MIFHQRVKTIKNSVRRFIMIRSAKIDDIDSIMKFIDREWRKNHILARDPSFFEYMYVLDGNVHFVISLDDGCINGILGYIPYDKKCKQISLTVWKALKSADGMIGMRLLKFVCDTLKPEIVATPGVNPRTTTAIYKFFKYKVDKMKHYYRLNRLAKFKIADVKDSTILLPIDAKGEVKEIIAFEDYLNANIIYENNAIKKENWYIKQRYFEHPVYQYRCFLVTKRNENALFIICRDQVIEDSKCLRVVDMLGNYQILSSFTKWIDAELVRAKYEYIDCYVIGLKKELFQSSGWSDTDDSSNIIPNYFEPFEKRNIDIYYSSKPADMIIFRGDGDQDRPN